MFENDVMVQNRKFSVKFDREFCYLVIIKNSIYRTPVYNFINDRLVDESAVLRSLS